MKLPQYLSPGAGMQARELSEQEKVGVIKQAEDLEALYRRCAAHQGPRFRLAGFHPESHHAFGAASPDA